MQLVMQVVPSMPVHPGDGILCTVWVAWDPSTPDPSGGNVFFQFVNSSVANGQGNPLMVTAHTRIVDESGFNYLINFLGKTAEWIVERPTIVQGGKRVGLFDLPNYQSQCFAKTQKNYDGFYIDATTAWAHLGINEHESFEYSGHDNFLYTMTGSTDLSIATPLDSHSMCFNWLAFH